MGGVFTNVKAQIAQLAQSAWDFLLFLIVVVVALGGLYSVLHGAIGSAMGAGRSVQFAVLAAAGLAVMALVAFLLIPEMARALKSMQPSPPW
jgi:hypothetical protein